MRDNCLFELVDAQIMTLIIETTHLITIVPRNCLVKIDVASLAGTTERWEKRMGSWNYYLQK